MSDSFNPITHPFSAGYELVQNAAIHMYQDDDAIMDSEMLASLRQRFGSPVVGKVGGIHYQFKPTRSIPRAALAVPERNHDDPAALLIQK